MTTSRTTSPKKKFRNGPWTLPTIWTSSSASTTRSMPPSTRGTCGEKGSNTRSMAGRISALDEKLAALGQTQEDYLPSEIEKFKGRHRMRNFLTLIRL